MASLTERTEGQTDDPLAAKIVEVDLGPKKQLNWVMLTFMTYIAVFGGGAYSVEAQVAAGYPLLTLAGLVFLPWLSGFPLALVTAELSAAMPDNGGYLVWLETAFGRFWGFFIGWIRVLNRVIDLSLYPVLFSSYLREYFEFNRFFAPLFTLAIVVTSSVINIFGVKLMGVMAIGFSCVSLLPFVIFIVLAFPYVDPSTWILLPPNLSQVNWGLYLAVASWNVAGFDTMSHVAGEMEKPSHFYLANMGAMVLIALSGFLPVALMVSVDRDYGSYYAGYWPQLGDQLGGDWLKLLFVIGACVAMFATFNGYLFYGAMLFSNWSKDGLMEIPLLTLTNKYHAPYTAIILHAVIVFMLSFFDFEDLVQVSTAMYCISLVMIYVTFIFLRIRRPEMTRPYKIGLGTKGLIAFVATAVLLSLLNVVFSMAAGILHFSLILVLNALGPILWIIRNKIREYQSRETVVVNSEDNDEVKLKLIDPKAEKSPGYVIARSFSASGLQNSTKSAENREDVAQVKLDENDGI